MQELGVAIKHHFAGGLYSKETVIPAGVKLTQHVHPYDHASALVSGKVLLEVDGICREVTGPAMLMIEAGKAHGVTALTDVVWHCIHITKDADPETVDQSILKARDE
jgi:quercetin dioxygenase-like cupin family protein